MSLCLRSAMIALSYATLPIHLELSLMQTRVVHAEKGYNPSRIPSRNNLRAIALPAARHPYGIPASIGNCNKDNCQVPPSGCHELVAARLVFGPVESQTRNSGEKELCTQYQRRFLQRFCHLVCISQDSFSRVHP